MRYLIFVSLLASVAMFSLGNIAIAESGDDEVAIEDMTIADIMKAAHKKPKHLLKKVATGAAKPAEQEELLQLYKALTKLEPPKGDAASWKAKTTLLVEAAEAALSKAEDADRQLTRAANCMACHQLHK